MKIYYIFGILCALVLVQGHEIPEEMKKTLEECGKEVGITEDAFKDKSKLDDPKMHCFQACIMKKMGTIANGKIVVDKQIEMMTKIVPEKVTDATKPKITECATKANEEKEECKLVGVFNKCIMEKLGLEQKKE